MIPATNKQPARTIRRRMTLPQKRDYYAKKIHALEMAQASLAIEEYALSLFHSEYERMQDYFITVAEKHLFEALAEYGAEPVRLSEIRQRAQEIANVCLPYGLKWEWKAHLQMLTEDKVLPPCYTDIFKLEEKEILEKQPKKK